MQALHATESELQLLGAILLEPKLLAKVQTKLDPGAFTSERTRAVFEALTRLKARGTGIDLIALEAELKRAGKLEKAGGRGFLADLAAQAVTTAALDYHLGQVKEAASRRALVGLAEAIIDGIKAGSTVADVASMARGRLMDLAGLAGDNGRRIVPQDKAVAKAFAQIEAARKASGLPGIPSGFPALDSRTGGFRRGELVVVAGRPSMGKTAFALNVAQAAAEAGTRVVFFSLEMPPSDLALRQIAGASGLDFGSLRRARLSDGELRSIVQAAGKVSALPLTFVDCPGCSIDDLVATAESLTLKEGIGLVVVDYLQLIRLRGRLEVREREVAEISGRVKALARDLQVPVLLLSQLNRQCESRPNKRPLLSDLRDSGAIEQDADIVAFLFRPWVYDSAGDPGEVELIVHKNRNGQTGVVRLYFDGGRQRFRNKTT